MNLDLVNVFRYENGLFLPGIPDEGKDRIDFEPIAEDILFDKEYPPVAHRGYFKRLWWDNDLKRMRLPRKESEFLVYRIVLIHKANVSWRQLDRLQIIQVADREPKVSDYLFSIHQGCELTIRQLYKKDRVIAVP